MLRHQLPVYSPIRATALASAAGSAFTDGDADRDHLAAQLAIAYSALRVVLTDSGTSALVLALRMLVGRGGLVAYPAYACVDLAAAARYVGVRVRLYDIDPATLSPDLDSLARVLKDGVASVVVAHLYGVPADIPAVTELACAHGAVVIEDAAQGAGGTVRGKPIGSFGPLTILSFGRGKGATGGRGGALLAITPDMARRLDAIDVAGRPSVGGKELMIATAQWAFGRPALYSLPRAVPGLRLGETVFRPAHEPRPLSSAAAALVRATLPAAQREAAIRQRNATILRGAIGNGDRVVAIRPIRDGIPGYLRFPVRDFSHRSEVPRLGIVRGYPRTLGEEPALRPCLAPNEAVPAGAGELRRSLFTLPVHSMVTEGDLHRLGQWLRSPDAGDVRRRTAPTV